MQRIPESADLMEAIQSFLMKEVMPLVKEDEFMNFKTLISWNMLGILARESRLGEEMIDLEIKSLINLLQDKTEKMPSTYQDKKDLVKNLNKVLAEKIREENICNPGSPEWEHLKQSLKNDLKIANPRFLSGGKK